MRMFLFLLAYSHIYDKSVFVNLTHQNTYQKRVSGNNIFELMQQNGEIYSKPANVYLIPPSPSV